MQGLPSLFGDLPLAPPPAGAKKGKKGSPKVPSIISIEDYMPDVRLFRIKELPIRIDPALLTKEALQQRPGMEWLGQVECTLIYPPSRDITAQQDYLENFLKELEQRAIRLPQAFCSVYPEGFNEPVLAVDLETTGLDNRTLYKEGPDGKLHLKSQTEIVGICLAISKFQGFYLPVMHTEEDGIPNWDYKTACHFLSLCNQRFVTIVHNGQYDREVMAGNGVALREFPYFIDTQQIHYVWDVNQKQHGLKKLSEQFLGRKMLEIGELFGSKDFIQFNLIPASCATVYGCSDGMNTWGLMEYFANLPDSPFKIQPIPLMVDHKMSDVLRSMYRTGAPIDAEYYFYAALDAIHYIDKLQVAIDELAGHPVEINSPAQLSDLLFKEFKLPTLEGQELNKQGNYSTAEDVLDELFEKYPDFTVLKYVVLYRKLNNQLAKFYAKALSNAFVDDFQPYLRVQYSFSQTNVPTGRLSSNSGDGRDRVSVKENKTSLGYNFKKGSWDCGFNSQGVTNSSFRKSKAKKIRALPPEAGYNLDDLYSKEERETLIKTVAKF